MAGSESQFAQGTPGKSVEFIDLWVDGPKTEAAVYRNGSADEDAIDLDDVGLEHDSLRTRLCRKADDSSDGCLIRRLRNSCNTGSQSCSDDPTSVPFGVYLTSRRDFSPLR
jgi:hypothetical protein